MISSFKARCAVFFLILMLCVPVFGATPIIDSWNNSITGDDDLSPEVDYNTNIQFNVSANETITTWNWYNDETVISNNYDNYTAAFTTAGYHNITVTGTNANGTTPQLTWTVYTGREVATTGISTEINESAYDMILESFEGTGNFELFLSAIVFPYTDILGAVFYLIIYGLAFYMQWDRQSNILMPVVVGLTLGGVLFGFLPSDYRVYAGLLILIGASSTVWTLYKDR